MQLDLEQSNNKHTNLV